MKRRKLWMTGGVALAGGAVYRFVRRKKHEPEPDPASDLRRKLDESRAAVGEREEFESAEVPVDQAEPGVDARRREVHDRAKSAVDEMRDPTAE
jgi:hypothetical protein